MRARKINLMKRRVIRICFLFAIVSAVFVIVFTSGNNTQAEEAADSCKLYTSITINPGDSLWSIASEHIDCHYSSIQDYINELMLINGLSSSTINANEHLLVPYYAS